MNYSQQPPPQLQLNLQLWDDTPFLQSTLRPSSSPLSQPHPIRQSFQQQQQNQLPVQPQQHPHYHHLCHLNLQQQQRQHITSPTAMKSISTSPLIPPPSSCIPSPTLDSGSRPSQHLLQRNNTTNRINSSNCNSNHGTYLQLQRQNSPSAQQPHEPFPTLMVIISWFFFFFKNKKCSRVRVK
jgi:hypothetical protein